MKNWNPHLNPYIFSIYVLIYTALKAIEAVNRGFSLNYTQLGVPIRKDSYGMLDILINLQQSAPVDTGLFDFTNLRIEQGDNLHMSAIQVVNL